MTRYVVTSRRGPRQWRSLAQQTDPMLETAMVEFPAAFDGAAAPARRQILQAMAASLALAGLTGCSARPDTRALPYVRTPEDLAADTARRYATAVTTVGGYAQPVLGETHQGRPTKLEGLPEHPASQGGADAFTQAALLGLYDPDRSSAPRREGQITEWSAFDRAMVENARRLDARSGEGLHLLTRRQTSPTFARQWRALQARWPAARWHVLEPVNDDLTLQASHRVFGRPLQVLPRLDQADVVVCLGGDPLGPGPAQTWNARGWSAARRRFQASGGTHRLFVAEPTPSLTGGRADERLATAAGRLGLILAALDAALQAKPWPAGLTARETGWTAAAAAALTAAGERGVILVGADQPIEVQALSLAINHRLGALDGPLALIEPVAAAGAQPLESLVAALNAGQVDTLVVVEADPAYAAPADLDFAAAAAKARLRIHAGLHVDETARLCQWHAPIEHDLEAWSDARAVDGSACFIQPLVTPFKSVRSRHALLETLQGRLEADAHALVRETWRQAWREPSAEAFEARWKAALRQGFDPDAAVPAKALSAAAQPWPGPPRDAGLEVVFRPDPCLWDGRFANNPWLQELPKPFNKVTWDNVLAIAPSLAKTLDLENGDVVRVEHGARAVEAAVWLTPGQARQTLTLFLGYGRRLPGQLGDARGHDAYALRTTASPGRITGVTLTPAGRKHALASTQEHQALAGETFVRTLTSGEARGPKATKSHPSFYPEKPTDSPAWGLSVDTDLCIGCNACVTACDAENNIAMVGKDEVAKGRQMHWMRIDHYYEGDPDHPVDHHLPVPCMHCEQAPCEMGCPVAATVHSPDGLNLQVYNRCIGTRTCSSYCPYKVRRFNWFDLTRDDPPERQAQRNPNVTVRTRGVMEKCTYCIQRISAARIQAKLEGRKIADGEVRTACQQTCPTNAIVFGDVSDPNSAVSRAKASARDYTLLEEMNTRPRTTYLARIRDGGEGE